jgi:membrane-bound serine protease (ClpP class)
MDVLEIVIVLTIVGFLMLAAEMFVPGMVLGIMGACSLIGAIALAFSHYGLVVGVFVLIGVGVVTMTGFIVWMNVFSHTAIGRRLTLMKASIPGEGEKDRPAAALLGQPGQAITPLRPAGTALIAGRRVDVVAEGELIEPGESVMVVFEEGMRVVVRKSSGTIPVVA